MSKTILLQLLITGVFLILEILFDSILQKLSDKEKPIYGKDETILFKYSKYYISFTSILGFIFIIMFFLILLLTPGAEPKKLEDYLCFGILLIFGIACGVILPLTMIRDKGVIISKEGISGPGFFKRNFIPWNEIISIKIKKGKMWRPSFLITIIGRKEKIYFDEMRVGRSIFIECLRKKCAVLYD